MHVSLTVLRAVYVFLLSALGNNLSWWCDVVLVQAAKRVRSGPWTSHVAPVRGSSTRRRSWTTRRSWSRWWLLLTLALLRGGGVCACLCDCVQDRSGDRSKKRDRSGRNASTGPGIIATLLVGRRVDTACHAVVGLG